MINVIGLGYIGLPTALMLAANRNKVVGTDLNYKIIYELNKKNITFCEEGLDELLVTALKNEIEFTTEYRVTDKYIVAVPTPYMLDTKKIDIQYLECALKKIIEVCLNNSIIVIESTVAPGTINQLKAFVEKFNNENKTINLVHAPERIIPGNMIYELQYNSRTVGTDDVKIGNIVKKWYETFCKGEILLTSIKVAELSKVIENTFRDVNIALANEISKICYAENIPTQHLIDIANKHPRVNILSPGIGVGGHCISVDPWFLVGDYPKITNLIKKAREINDSQPNFTFQIFLDLMKKNNILDLNKIGFYGITYKANIDDIRESPSLKFLSLCKEYFQMDTKVYDPFVKKKECEKQYLDFDEFINDVEVVVILVEHSHIKKHEEKINMTSKRIFNINDLIKNNYIE
ncbi:MAG: nucleotide sugar dehydrogenase [Sarcina sp.]